MNDDTKGFVPFKGTVDELLNHVDSIDPDRVERIVIDESEDVRLSDAEAIAYIKAESKITEEEAKMVLDEVKKEEINKALKALMETGLVEIVSYGSDGEPQYGLTDAGKLTAEGLKGNLTNGDQSDENSH